MVDDLGIRAEWTAFLGGDPRPLLGLYPRPTVITLPSFPIIPEGYSNCASIRVRYLTGPCERCFERASLRDPTRIDRDFWDRNNS